MSIPLAVLDTTDVGDVVRTPGAAWRITTPIAGAEDLERLARRLDTFQLWIHPSWTRAHPDVQLCTACAEPRETSSGRRRRHQHWLALDAQGAASGSVAHPQLALVLGDPHLRVLTGARDGAELLAVLARVHYLLGTHWHGTPGSTGVALLRDHLARAGHRLEPLPKEVRRLGPEPDFGWQRPLTERELRRKWVYVFDKHNMYLVAAGTVGLGAGAVEFKAQPAAFHARQPAYWHVQLKPWPSDALLPDPTRGAGPPRDPSAYRWLTTPSVEAAWSAGLVESIAACWYWPVHGTYLQTLSKVIRGAIVAVTGREDRVSAMTRSALKAVYAELLSGYLARNALADTEDPLYRPDWRDHVKAEARTRLWYSLRPLRDAGLAPIAVAHDAIYVPSDADSPDEVLGGLLTLGALPAQWAFQRRARLADVTDCLRESVGPCDALSARVRALAATA